MASGLPITPGTQDLGVYTPDMYTTLLNYKFYEDGFLEDIVNNNWEGDLRYGGSVNIRQMPNIRTRPMKANADIYYEQISGDSLKLEIDRIRSAAFAIDYFQASQNDINVKKMATQDANNNMVTDIQEEVLGEVYMQAASTVGAANVQVANSDGTLGPAGTNINETNVLKWISLAKQALRKKRINLRKGSFLVVPPEVETILTNSFLAAVQNSGDSESMQRKGYFGKINGFDIYISNTLPEDDDGTVHCLAGTKAAISFAGQYAKTQDVVLPNKFSDGTRMAMSYGFIVNFPDALVDLRAKFTG